MVSAKIYVALASFSGFANAHMFLASPVRLSSPAVTNGPLLADGSNFPCQHTGGGYEGPTNTFPLGSTQKLAFEGVAVHGGGSCQVSLTTDEAPTKSSKFYVIHSIQGGCPAQNQAGNLPGDDATAPDPYTYDYPIPSNIPSGNYTLAWTWFNKIGNREFYMNCAAVSLTGTGGSASNLEALPEMTTGNIGNGCTTTEGSDYKYYAPGNSVVNLNSSALIFPVGSSCVGASGSSSGNGSGAGGGSSGNGSGSSSSNTPAAAATSASATYGGGGASASATFGGGGSVGLSSSTTATTPAASMTGGASITAAAPSATGTGSGSSSSGTNSTGGNTQTAGTACSPEGEWNCIGGTSYQQCASGLWSVAMPMAAGTQCQPGISTAMDVNAIASGNKIKRQSLWRRRSHVARHAHR